MPITNDLLLRALRCCNMTRPPVWLMRQAGRHLLEYRRLRERYSFLEMCHHPELIAEVTLMPVKTYEVDAAILFSDILVIPEAMGLGLRFEDNIGPIIERPITSQADLKVLPERCDLTRLDYVFQGIKQVKPLLNVPLIGFCGAPFTVASYIIEGRSSRDLKKTKQWMFRDPSSFHKLLDIIADWSIEYLRQQIHAGVDAVQLFDSWANFLAHRQFQEFSSRYLKKIIDGIRSTGTPTILFCRGSSVFAPDLAELSPSAVGLDWNCSLANIRKIIPAPIALQGNLDPDLLYAPFARIEREVSALLDAMSADPGYIFNLGHGVHPDVPEDAVRTVIQTVKGKS
jgi:uroporphyrinogen decarboxylase